MYRDVVTLFCRYADGDKVYWRVYTLENVDFNADKARILNTYGESSQDRAILHLRLKNGFCNGLLYVEPKQYTGAEGTFSLKSGLDFDFFAVGSYTVNEIQALNSSGVIDDDDYPDGFYNVFNRTHDNVFIITSAAKYSVIPHIEVTGR